jgi:CBS domain-containing protein
MLKASDIMTYDVATIRGWATAAEAIKLMKLKNLRALIVESRNSEDSYGMLTHTDIITKVVAYGKDAEKIRVHEIMTKPCIVVNPDLGVEYVARLFANTGIRVAPVIQGDLLGIISESDILYKGDFLENPKVPLLRRELERAIADAKAVAVTSGATSTASMEAWELVDELESEAAYQEGVVMPEKMAFEVFCEDHPEVLKVRHDRLVAAQS